MKMHEGNKTAWDDVDLTLLSPKKSIPQWDQNLTSISDITPKSANHTLLASFKQYNNKN